MMWDTISLGDIALQRGGSVDPKKYLDEEFELYSIPAFDAGAPEVATGAEIGSAKKAVQPDDVMISRIVPHIRRACVVGKANGRRQIASGEWIIFRSNKVWPQYLKWVLVGDTFHSAFMSTVSGVGGSLLRARPAEVYKIQIPLPPLAEQKRIAAILDAADALRAKRRESLDQLDALLQSTFLDIFGDPVTNPKGWKLVNGAKVCSRITVGIVVQPASYYQETGVPALRSLNIRANKIETNDLVYVSAEDNEKVLHKTRVWKGNVLLVRSGQPGTAAIVPEELDGVNAIDILITTPDQNVISPVYLCNYFNSPGGKRMALGAQRGQIQKHLNVGALRVAPIPLPPLDLQRRFATIVESVEKQKTRLREHLTELDTLFASLQQRAFNGDL